MNKNQIKRFIAILERHPVYLSMVTGTITGVFSGVISGTIVGFILNSFVNK